MEKISTAAAAARLQGEATTDGRRSGTREFQAAGEGHKFAFHGHFTVGRGFLARPVWQGRGKNLCGCPPIRGGAGEKWAGCRMGEGVEWTGAAVCCRPCPAQCGDGGLWIPACSCFKPPSLRCAQVHFLRLHTPEQLHSRDGGWQSCRGGGTGELEGWRCGANIHSLSRLRSARQRRPLPRPQRSPLGAPVARVPCNGAGAGARRGVAVAGRAGQAVGRGGGAGRAAWGGVGWGWGGVCLWHVGGSPSGWRQQHEPGLLRGVHEGMPRAAAPAHSPPCAAGSAGAGAVDHSAEGAGGTLHRDGVGWVHA